MSEITAANRNPNPQILCKTSEKQHQGKREERESMLLLQNKLPLTNVKKKNNKKKKNYGLPPKTTLKFHYDSGKHLLTDYLEYMQKLQNWMEKAAS